MKPNAETYGSQTNCRAVFDLEVRRSSPFKFGEVGHKGLAQHCPVHLLNLRKVRQ